MARARFPGFGQTLTRCAHLRKTCTEDETKFTLPFYGFCGLHSRMLFAELTLRGRAHRLFSSPQAGEDPKRADSVNFAFFGLWPIPLLERLFWPPPSSSRRFNRRFHSHGDCTWRGSRYSLHLKALHHRSRGRSSLA